MYSPLSLGEWSAERRLTAGSGWSERALSVSDFSHAVDLAMYPPATAHRLKSSAGSALLTRMGLPFVKV